MSDIPAKGKYIVIAKIDDKIEKMIETYHLHVAFPARLEKDYILDKNINKLNLDYDRSIPVPVRRVCQCRPLCELRDRPDEVEAVSKQLKKIRNKIKKGEIVLIITPTSFHKHNPKLKENAPIIYKLLEKFWLNDLLINNHDIIELEL